MHLQSLFRKAFLYFLFLGFSSFYCAAAPYIVLTKPDTIYLNLGDTYKEPGATAYSSSGASLGSSSIVISIPTGFSFSGPELKSGTYRLSYNFTDSNGDHAPTAYRYVIVRPDTTPPKLIVAGPDTTYVPVNKASKAYVTLPAVIESEDNVDGLVADTMTPSQIPLNKLDTVKIRYSTSDKSSNRSVVYRWVIVYDSIAPVITLEHQYDTAYIYQKYADKGVSATDNYDDSVSISVNNLFLLNFPDGKANYLGVIPIIYTAKDGSGNTSTATRYVKTVDTFPPKIRLKGKQYDTLNIYQTYTDPGYTVKDALFPAIRITITKAGTFYPTFPTGKVNKIGTYTIAYTATNPSGISITVYRYITVIDTLKPHIKLVGSQSDSVQLLSAYNDPGTVPTDPYYGSDNLTITKSGSFYGAFPNGNPTALGKYCITYTVTNGSGLKDSVTRHVKVIDTVPPIIYLAGKLNDTLCAGTPYIDAGYGYSDLYYAANQIKVDTVSYYHYETDTLTGPYNVQYRATNPSGRSSLSAKRTVLVRSHKECKNALDERELLESSLKVYPNPTPGIMNVQLNMRPSDELINISITDLLGHVIYCTNGHINQQIILRLDLSNYAAGIYMLHVTSANARVSRQIVVLK